MRQSELSRLVNLRARASNRMGARDNAIRLRNGNPRNRAHFRINRNDDGGGGGGGFHAHARTQVLQEWPPLTPTRTPLPSLYPASNCHIYTTNDGRAHARETAMLLDVACVRYNRNQRS